jgi:hypothetical protein
LTRRFRNCPSDLAVFLNPDDRKLWGLSHLLLLDTFADFVEGCISRVFVVLVEVGQRLHQLVALRHGKVGVVQGLAALAVRVEPPVALQDRLIEQRALGAQEGLHDQTLVG